MALVSGVKGEAGPNDSSSTGDEHVQHDSSPSREGGVRQQQQQRQRQHEAMWNFIFSCLEVYQSSAADEVKRLVCGTRKRSYRYGDLTVWIAATTDGLKRAFRRMQARVVERKRKEVQEPGRRLDPFTRASIHTFVATQNRFLRDEFVIKLGFVDGPRLEKVFPVARDDKQRAIVSQIAAGSTAWTAGQAAGQRMTVTLTIDFSASGSGEKRQAPDGVGAAAPTVDFTDVSDKRWETYFEQARQATKLARRREEALTKVAVGPIAAGEGWITAAQQRVLGWGRRNPMDGGDDDEDDPPPLLMSDSDSDSDSFASEGDHGGGGGSNCDGVADADVSRSGAPTAADAQGGGGGGGRKRGAPEPKRRKGKKKGGTPAPVPSAIPVDMMAVLPTINEAADEDDETNAAMPTVAPGAPPAAAAAAAAAESTATRGFGAKDDMHCELDYTTTMRWINDVAAGRVTAHPGQVHRYFRGRLDESVIPAILQAFRKDVRAAVIRCAEMLGENVEGLSSGSGHGGGDGGGSEGVGEAGRLGDNDNDVDEHDAPAIVSRANYLLDTGCQDDGRLQSLLDKAKGKERINAVRKRLRKAIKALRQQQPQRNQEGQQQQQQQVDKTKHTETGIPALSPQVQRGSDEGSEPLGTKMGTAEEGTGVARTGRTANVHPAFAPLDGGYAGDMYSGRGSGRRASFERPEDMDMDIDSGSDGEGGSGSSDSGGDYGVARGSSESVGFAAFNVADRFSGTNTNNAFSAFDSANSTPAATGAGDGALDGLIKHADELVANGCQDKKQLDRLLDRVRGKPGLDKTRKMLKKAIKDINRRQESESTAAVWGASAAPDSAMPAHTVSNAYNSGDDYDQEDFPMNTKKNKKKNKNIGGGGNGGKDPGVLGISRTVERQLEKQRKNWMNGHVRQLVRCRAGLVARVIGNNGVTLKEVQGKSCTRVDVLRDANNDRQHRTITVRGLPKGVSHAVRLLQQIIGETAFIGEVERHRHDRQQAWTAAKLPTPSVARGGRGTTGKTGTFTGKDDANMDDNNNLNDGGGGGGHRAAGRKHMRTKGTNGEDRKGRNDTKNDRTIREDKKARGVTWAIDTALHESDATENSETNPTGARGPLGAFAGPTSQARPEGAAAGGVGTWDLDGIDGTASADDPNYNTDGGAASPSGRATRDRGDGFDGLGARMNHTCVDGGDEDGGGGDDGYASRSSVNEEPADAQRTKDMVERLHAASRVGGGQAATTARSVGQRQQYPAAGGLAGAVDGEFHDGARAANAAAGSGPSAPTARELNAQPIHATAFGGDYGERGVPSGRQHHAVLGRLSNNDIGRGFATPPQYAANADSPAPAPGGADAHADSVNNDASGLPARQLYSSYRPSPSPSAVSGAFFETGTGNHEHGTYDGGAGSGGDSGYSRKPPGFGDTGGFTPGPLPPVDECSAETTTTTTNTGHRPSFPSTTNAARTSGFFGAASAGAGYDTCSAQPLPPVPEHNGATAASVDRYTSHASLPGAADATATAAAAASAYAASPPARTTHNYQSMAASASYLDPTPATSTAPARAADPASSFTAAAAAAAARFSSPDARLDDGAQAVPAATNDIYAGLTSASTHTQQSPTPRTLNDHHRHHHQQATPAPAERTQRINAGGGRHERRESEDVDPSWGSSQMPPDPGNTDVGARGGGGNVNGGQDGLVGGGGHGAAGSMAMEEAVRRQQQQLLRQVQQDRPHLEVVLKAAKCERLLPLLLARQVGLRKLAVMNEEDFKALENEDDPFTRVARGPQLKIRHHCKKMLEELGIEAEPEGNGGGDDDKDEEKNGGDSEGKCRVCWEEEIQIIFCPCGHEACCVDCGKALENGPCPICRVPVESAVRAYKG